MLTILHGEQLLKSRQALVVYLEKAAQANTPVVRLNAKELTEGALEQVLGSQSLFEEQPLLVIEELHSLLKSKKKDRLIQLVAGSKNALILWEKRTLTPTMLKKFAGADVQLFKASNQLFPWLDSLGQSDKQAQLKQLQLLKKEEGAGFIFAMLARQVRLLISALDDGQITGAPFVISKVKKQAHRFQLSQLVLAHQRLLEIDYQQKRSGSHWNLDQELDLWVLSL